jgi:hypothetical protein
MPDNHPMLYACYRKGMIIPSVLVLAGCAVEGGVVVQARIPVGVQQEVNIPKGHMPPPGKCRVWYPDRPPGQQPPPGDCAQLKHRVPPDAVLVEG